MGQAPAALNAAAPHWQRRSPALRCVAASVSIAVTLGSLLMLRSQRSLEAATPPSISMLLIAPAEAPVLKAAAKVERSKTTSHGLRARTPVQASTLSIAPANTTSHTVDAEPLEMAAPPKGPSSAPLRLHAAPLATNEGAIRTMARRSGVAFDSPRPSGDERLSNAVAKTAIPDCLAPNAGGTLLSIPKIAYTAITGRCR